MAFGIATGLSSSWRRQGRVRPCRGVGRLQMSVPGVVGRQTRCRHILVSTEEMAAEVLHQVKQGASFPELASFLTALESACVQLALSPVVIQNAAAEISDGFDRISTGETQPFGWHVALVEATDEETLERKITVSEFERRRTCGTPQDWQLVDVRDENERGEAAIDGFQSLPMSQHPVWTEALSRGEILDLDKETILMCHKGSRSVHMCDYLAQLGVRNPRSLVGGIDEYARIVDQSIPRY